MRQGQRIYPLLRCTFHSIVINSLKPYYNIWNLNTCVENSVSIQEVNIVLLKKFTWGQGFPSRVKLC